MRRWPLPLQPRFIAYTIVLVITAILLFEYIFEFTSFYVGIPLLLFSILAVIGTIDLIQPRHAVLRNYPLTAHIRFILEEIRPEIRQYFLESEKDGTPFSRDKRAIVYQRAKQALDKRPFGTQSDVYSTGFEWLHHSIAPKSIVREPFRLIVGGSDCSKPYSASIFNISAMSFGALSPNAIRALNIGAKRGNFAHDTGEGGYSSYHRENGGDIIWEIGSGYFSCRNDDGTFCPGKFEEAAQYDQVKMIELKLSQGAKPGHGGVLPAAKVSAEIALARGVPAGVDCVSPSRHSAFSTPIEMMEFIATLRRLSGGKPTGFKLCVGHPWEFLAVCKAMLETQITQTSL
jgi:glutamate synthase domain-containing protein 2